MSNIYREIPLIVLAVLLNLRFEDLSKAMAAMSLLQKCHLVAVRSACSKAVTTLVRRREGMA